MQPGALTALPFLVACLGIATFSMMDVLMKGLSIALGAYNAMLWRLAIGLVIGALLFFGKRTPWPRRETMKLHWIRGAITASMATTFFFGLARVPIAEAIALSFIAPLITLYLAAVVLGERIGRESIIASLLGLAGVLVILSARATGRYDADALAGVAAIFVSAVLYAVNLILQRRQAQVASPTEIAFFQNLTAFSVLLLGAPFLAVVPDLAHLPGLAGSALLSVVSLLLLSWAYARAEAQVLVPVEYTAFIWASLLGWLAYNETVTATTILGTALIVAGCIIAARRRPVHVEATAL
jgi:S-adenosylmethionine uptake transporter